MSKRAPSAEVAAQPVHLGKLFIGHVVECRCGTTEAITRNGQALGRFNSSQAAANALAVAALGNEH